MQNLGDQRNGDTDTQLTRRRSRAQAGLVIGYVGTAATAIYALICAPLDLMGYPAIWITIAYLSMALATIAFLHCMTTYFWIPFRRFDPKKYSHEFKRRPFLPIASRMTPISVRCPAWMMPLFYGWLAVIAITFNFLTNWDTQANSVNPPLWFIVGVAAIPPGLFWNCAMAAYAALDALKFEEQDRSKHPVPLSGPTAPPPEK